MNRLFCALFIIYDEQFKNHFNASVLTVKILAFPRFLINTRVISCQSYNHIPHTHVWKYSKAITNQTVLNTCV